MSKKMTDEECANAVNLAQQWWTPEHVGVRLANEVLRIRASEADKAAELERLKAELATATEESTKHLEWMREERARADAAGAELARLTPSGQVAEDRNIVAMELGSHPSQAKAQAAAARLAAQAQGYESMKVECNAAVADIAAQREVFRHILERFESPFGGTANDRMRATVAACTQALARPHPGATILAEHTKALEAAHADGRRDALLQALDRLGMGSACMYRDPTATDTRLSDELWEHVRWLEVRARNAGREEAALACDLKAANGQGWEAWASAAAAIRAKKEPES